MCLVENTEMKYLLGSCLVPGCKDPASLSNYTIFSTILSKIVTYADFPNWAPPTLENPDNAVKVFPPYVATSNASCASTENCTA